MGVILGSLKRKLKHLLVSSLQCLNSHEMMVYTLCMVYVVVGFESRTSLNFFQAFFSQTAKVAYITAMIFPHIINFISQVKDLFTDCLFLVQYQKYGLSLYISREKDDCYYIQTWHKDLFSNYNLILRKLYQKNALKSAQKYKRNVFMAPGHPIILLTSN